MDQVGGLGRGRGTCRVMRSWGPPGEHSWGHRAEKVQRLVHRQGERQADNERGDERGGLQSGRPGSMKNPHLNIWEPTQSGDSALEMEEIPPQAAT